MQPAPGRPNVFAGPHVDRLKLPRSDAPPAAELLARARIVAVWRSRCLLRREPGPNACLLEAAAAAVPVAEMILLGEYRGSAVFVAEFGGDAPPALADGAEFVDLRAAASMLPHDDAGLVAYARAMVSFRRRHRHCGCCGTPTVPRQSGHVMACPREGCGQLSFPRIDPAVIVLVSDGDRALLGRQRGWPAGRYSTVAGFVEPGESLEDAVCREVLEETGVETAEVRYQSSQPWPFPNSLMLGFRATARTTQIRLGDDELEDARWFSRAQIAAGEPLLPFRQSISWRLIEDWYDEGAARPLAEEPRAGRWEREP